MEMEFKMFVKMRYPRSEELIKKITNRCHWILDNCIEVFVPDTWHDIVLQSICSMEKTVDKYYGPFMFNKATIYISQIKEKFGLLRIYVEFPEKEDFYSKEFKNEIFNILDIAEMQSGEICSVCGSKENINGPFQDEKCRMPAKCSECEDKKSSIEA